MPQVYVTLFDWNWAPLGHELVEASESTTRLQIHELCKAAVARILGGIPPPADVHMTVTAGRVPTVEEAKAYYAAEGGPAIEEWTSPPRIEINSHRCGGERPLQGV